MVDSERIISRYRDLMRYLDWDERGDAETLAAIVPSLEPRLPGLIDDLYEEMSRHPEAASVSTGGVEQVDRLKASLHRWLLGTLRHQPDGRHAERCWRIGRRHSEIGLGSIDVIVALARLRSGINRALRSEWTGGPEALAEAIRVFNRRLDLDLGLIQGAYDAESEDRPQRAERLATLGQVAGGLAHELRNPLNAIKTSAYYLRNARSASPETRAEHLERIERGVDRADSVIEALSSVSRPPAPDRRPTALGPATREALESDPPGPGGAVELELSDWLAVEADPGQLRIVLGNLIRNACEAMPEGGNLRFRGRRDGEGRVELAVADSGTGMGPELVDRAIGPLYSTKARGLGLGLAISKAILEKHGGALRVEGTPGLGSTFTVVLPGGPDLGGPRA